MDCSNRFCTYWHQGGCRLEVVSLDEQGQCRQCVKVAVPEEILQPARETLLQRFGKTEWTAPEKPDPHVAEKERARPNGRAQREGGEK